jgi:hypothetical protein
LKKEIEKAIPSMQLNSGRIYVHLGHKLLNPRPKVLLFGRFTAGKDKRFLTIA